jgi:uncharacterized protein Yka (UPF0111/DUF47 family)
MRFRPFRLVRDLSGRSSADMVELLLRQTTASLEGARVARKAAGTAHSSAAARDDITVVEHTGDQARAQLVAMLAVSLVTPVDREDLFRVSRSIDDVLDNLRDFVRELDMFGMSDESLVPVIDAVIDGLELLYPAVAAVADSANDVGARVLAAKKSCNDIRRSYQRQLVRLLDGEVTTSMLRRRELLRRLDVVGLRLGEAVDALADAAVKRGL